MDSPTGLMPLNPLAALPGQAFSTPEGTLVELDQLLAELAQSRQTIALRDAALQAVELKIQALTL